MDDAWQEFLLNLLSYAIVGGASGAVLAAVLLAVPSVRRRLLPMPRLRPGRWSGGEVLLCLLAMQIARVVALWAVLSILTAMGTPERRLDAPEVYRLAVLGSPLFTALTLAIVTTVLFAFSRTRPNQYGITWARWPANVALGILFFLILAPLSLAIHFLVQSIFGSETHPIELAVKRGFASWEWALLVFMTVIGAPLTEEILFRGVLQGWLRRATLMGHITLLLAVLGFAVTPLAHALSTLLGQAVEPAPGAAVPATPPDWLGPVALLAIFSVLVAGYGWWLWRLGRRYLHGAVEVWLWRPGAQITWPAPAADPEDADTDDADTDDADTDDEPPEPAAAADDPLLPARQQEWAWANARLAVLGSAMLFALPHGWPDAVPMVVFGLGQGWLAYRTQSLIGCMVCHALFNSVACIVLAWSTG